MLRKEIVICENCKGSGKEEDGSVCGFCQGSGKAIRVDFSLVIPYSDKDYENIGLTSETVKILVTDLIKAKNENTNS